MSIPFKDLIRDWPPERLAAVEARAAHLIAEELTMRDLRLARDLTQVQLAKLLGIGQEQVSRLEQKSDMLLSTLGSYVQAMGGRLRFIAEFPDRPAVEVVRFADVFEERKPAAGKRKAVAP